ncbi:MAG: hypothetical protein OXK78_04550, partial [Caldilineaceae bacterium]|nr:hypothetical protein [Caldilineaceae bacterium]
MPRKLGGELAGAFQICGGNILVENQRQQRLKLFAGFWESSRAGTRPALTGIRWRWRDVVWLSIFYQAPVTNSDTRTTMRVVGEGALGGGGPPPKGG